MKQKNSRVLKKEKRVIVKTMLALLILVLMVGCGGEGDFSFVTKEDISSATLVGYGLIPFEKVMEYYIENVTKKAESVSSVLYGWGKGWRGNYDVDFENVNSDEVAVSYNIRMVYEEEEARANEMPENYVISFYMIHNTKENTLTLKGGSENEDGEEHPMSLSEAYYQLDCIFSEYKFMNRL